MDSPLVFTAQEAAAYCGVTRQRIYAAAASGQLAAVPDNPRQFSRSALDEWQKRKYRNGTNNSALVLPCTNCSQPVTTWPSKVTTETGNRFCNRACYLAWRHGKQPLTL